MNAQLKPQAGTAASLEHLTVRNSYAALPEDFYSRVRPMPLQTARMLHVNPEGCALLGLTPEALRTDAALQVLSGAAPFPGGESVAAVYSGHQFGVWAGQLGDGRAHLIAEVQGPQGSWEVQLKGSGRTPYSRMGDGRAVLRSSVREYLAAEAMHGLGIPTTRSLALVASDDPVRRETMETAAIVTRLAPSFVRFGSFEHWYAQRRAGLLQRLCDDIIDRFYPECRAAGGTGDVVIARWLAAVTDRTAALMADWLAVGFCHGVMNTDNMSILGLTMDYGPYAFMDGFKANHICNHSDHEGRYAWNAQPAVAHWNLFRLAEALQPLVPDVEMLRDAVRGFEAAFMTHWRERQRRKLGLAQWRDEEDDTLMDGLWRQMHTSGADFTLTFRALAGVAAGDTGAFLDQFADRAGAAQWLQTYQARLAQDGLPPEAVAAGMNRANPLYVLRNHLAELAIRAAEQGDASEIENLLECLRNPWESRPGFEHYARQAPDWSAGLVISCSS
ncbi:protein adenylyltransferase SelO [Kerstersia gyiorum]|uniref:Protein nucleotidyltransferase YdiU n=1 Tax=Kerstersia gyiorum TaxID=206506 RepID=A0A171KUS0_9BURK|nr:YdiU family protein [Kerstersia gyiorum]MCO7643627.1 YdiU family protein [Pseudomonas sp. S 311-6]KAB0543567.1 YdiU family protein [Kerstersia gyiorum]KKO72637.1 hypothetical protein AAV32_06380 [Kerstersia gyiorum]MCP1634153.1 uncharacterized protein YdiU (UPF0061 family) [Kerstersia gyiorum]MCP1637689.1 uncharacterized protein YdiU (UPF0061 family) [Kerstersia gyiorum]